MSQFSVTLRWASSKNSLLKPLKSGSKITKKQFLHMKGLRPQRKGPDQFNQSTYHLAGEHAQAVTLLNGNMEIQKFLTRGAGCTSNCFLVQDDNDRIQQGFWRQGDYGLSSEPNALRIEDDLAEFPWGYPAFCHLKLVRFFREAGVFTWKFQGRFVLLWMSFGRVNPGAQPESVYIGVSKLSCVLCVVLLKALCDTKLTTINATLILILLNRHVVWMCQKSCK